MSTPLHTHAELAEQLRLPLSTVVDLRKREGWAHVRLGRAIRFTEEQMAEIVARHTVSDKPVAAPVFEGQRPSRGRRS